MKILSRWGEFVCLEAGYTVTCILGEKKTPNLKNYSPTVIVYLNT